MMHPHLPSLPRSWQYRASVSRKISRLARKCLIRPRFETGRTTGLMPPRNRLTASLGAPHGDPGFRPDGETVLSGAGSPEQLSCAIVDGWRCAAGRTRAQSDSEEFKSALSVWWPLGDRPRVRETEPPGRE